MNIKELLILLSVASATLFVTLLRYYLDLGDIYKNKIIVFVGHKIMKSSSMVIYFKDQTMKEWKAKEILLIDFATFIPFEQTIQELFGDMDGEYGDDSRSVKAIDLTVERTLRTRFNEFLMRIERPTFDPKLLNEETLKLVKD